MNLGLILVAFLVVVLAVSRFVLVWGPPWLDFVFIALFGVVLLVRYFMAPVKSESSENNKKGNSSGAP